MLNEERRAKILELVQEKGRVQVKELSQRFKISEVTIRNDLKKLHVRGFVQRAHGGAITLGIVQTDHTLYEKYKLHADEPTNLKGDFQGSHSFRCAAPRPMKMDDSPFEGGVGGCP